jgi:hypothetical protein
MKRYSACVHLATVAVCASCAWAATLNVGPGRTYTSIQSAINAAANGDTILVDSGLYQGPNATMVFDGPSNITVKGNGPTRPILDQNGPQYSVWGKGICTVSAASSNITFDSLEFIHGEVRTGDTGTNGAGIRWDGSGLCHVINCSFHDNQEGFFGTTQTGSDILIEKTVIYDNGAPASPGAKHNIYVGSGAEGGVDTFTLLYSWVYNSRYAHGVKTSAATSRILYNRLGDELTAVSPLTWGGGVGNAIDIPSGGLAYVIGNMITKGQAVSDSDGNVLRYAEERIFPSYAKKAYILYNTFNGERSSGQNNFITISPTYSPDPAIICDNIFYSTNPGDVIYTAGSTVDTNFVSTDPTLSNAWNILTWSASAPHFWTGLVNVGRTDACAPAAVLTLDYHLVGSPFEVCDAALQPGSGGLPSTGPDNFPLSAVKQFVNSPSNNPTLVGENRKECRDLGAYEDGNVTTTNQAPFVTAGPSLKPPGTVFTNHVLPKTNAWLLGAAIDDGLPSVPGAMTYTWSKISGPGTFTPAANALSTTANFSQTGTYTLQLAAFDGALTGTDTCTVYVEDLVVDAGSDQSITVGATANVAVTVSTTGPSTSYKYLWSVVSKPAGATLTWSPLDGNGNPTYANQTVSGFTVPGDYVLRVRVSDGGLYVYDTVTITAGGHPGDINNSGAVDVSDLLILAAAWGSVKGPPASPNWNPAADLNGDGVIDAADLLILAANFGWHQ